MPDAWTYSDWDSQSDDSSRLERLKLHIQELMNHIIRCEASDIETELDPKILPILYQERNRLIASGADSSASASSVSVSQAVYASARNQVSFG